MVRTYGLKLESWYINSSYRLGGKIKDRYYESPGGINVRLKISLRNAATFVDYSDQGFSAIVEYFASFKTFKADEIKYIGTFLQFKFPA